MYEASHTKRMLRAWEQKAVENKWKEQENGKCGLLDVRKMEESKQPRKKVTLKEPNQ